MFIFSSSQTLFYRVCFVAKRYNGMTIMIIFVVLNRTSEFAAVRESRIRDVRFSGQYVEPERTEEIDSRNFSRSLNSAREFGSDRNRVDFSLSKTVHCIITTILRTTENAETATIGNIIV